MITTHRIDSDIQRAVVEELEWDPRIESAGISARVENGIVTLRGSVPSHAMRLAARDGVHHVRGVLDVVDELQVRPARSAESDQQLAAKVRQVLTWDVYVPDTRIRSTVSDGWVTLEGDVDRLHEREDAARAVERLQGVRGVTNRIAVKHPELEAARIRASLEAALQRRAAREAKRLEIEVDGGTVRLSGAVDSWADKRALEKLAQHTPGVVAVENRLRIDPHV